MNLQEISILEKYLTPEEIKETVITTLQSVITEEAKHAKVSYGEYMFENSEKSINWLIPSIIREYIIGEFKEDIKTKAKEKINDLKIDDIFGHSRDLKQYPDSMNKIEARRIVNNVLNNSQEEIKARIIQVIKNQSNEDFIAYFSNAYVEKIYSILDNIKNNKT